MSLFGEFMSVSHSDSHCIIDGVYPYHLYIEGP